MRIALAAMGLAFARTRYHFQGLFLANLVATIVSLPLVLVAVVIAALVREPIGVALGIMLLVAILPNPAAAGLHYLARQMVEDNMFYASDQWDGLRMYWRFALRVWLVSVLISAIILANIFFYAQGKVPLSPLFVLVFVYILVVWLAMHLYVYPLILRQEDRKVIQVLRNALTMTLGRPLSTAIVLPFWLLVIFAGTLSGLLAVILLGLAAAMQHALAGLLIPTFEHIEDE